MKRKDTLTDFYVLSDECTQKNLVKAATFSLRVYLSLCVMMMHSKNDLWAYYELWSRRFYFS